MSRAQITLYDEDAARFRELQEEVARRRPGSHPNNAELVRVLMDAVDIHEL